tara:strand:- start:83 stop:439 length:357 start_codon:yes stop_codon:yes gene_type:complete
MKKSLSEIYFDAISEITNKTGFSVDVNLVINNLENPPSKEQILEKAKEIEAREPIRILREKRDILITQTDWMANSDVTMSDAWRTYRQALRDLPANSPNAALDENGQLINVTWPTPPE